MAEAARGGLAIRVGEWGAEVGEQAECVECWWFFGVVG